MRHRWTLVVGLVGIAALAGAQGGGSRDPRYRMQEALAVTAADPYLRLDLGGVLTRGEAETTFAIRTDWASGLDARGRPAAWVRMDLAQDGLSLQTIVGDGVHLWNYRRPSHDYSTVQYGNPDGAPPAGFLGRLMQGLAQQTRGVAVWPARLLQDLHTPGPAGVWRPWMPTATLSSEGEWVTEILGERMRIDYRLVAPSKEEPERLTEIRFAETVVTSAGVQTTTWRMTISGSARPLPGADFAFVPPAGARALGTRVTPPAEP